MIFQKHRTHLSPLQDLPMTSHCSEHETCTWSLIRKARKARCLLAPADLSCAHLLRSRPPTLLSFVWLVVCPSCQSDLLQFSVHPLSPFGFSPPVTEVIVSSSASCSGIVVLLDCCVHLDVPQTPQTQGFSRCILYFPFFLLCSP